MHNIHNEFGSVETRLLDVKNELTSLIIKHGSCQAEVSLYGGQVLTWQPEGHRPVFWLSKTANYQETKPIRGGIPICWPWFSLNDKASKNESKYHGFARLQVWDVESISITEKSVTVTLTWQGENMDVLFPNACKLRQILVFGETFKQTLEMTNLSDVPVEYTAALHCYFKVSNPENISVDSLSLAEYQDKITDKIEQPEHLDNCIGRIDRVYFENKTQCIIDKKWQRTIKVIPENTKQWVLWNPGAELSLSMEDVHEQGENEFVCLEAANTQWQEIPANSTVSMGQTVKVF